MRRLIREIRQRMLKNGFIAKFEIPREVSKTRTRPLWRMTPAWEAHLQEIAAERQRKLLDVGDVKHSYKGSGQ